MGWTIGNAAFMHRGNTVSADADGHSLAWCCPCGTAVLFVYADGRNGSSASCPSTCKNCKSKYYLDPPFERSPEPPKETKLRSLTMQIVRL